MRQAAGQKADASEKGKGVAAEVRPLQVFAGFSLCAVLATSTLLSVGQAAAGYLSEGTNGQVLERTVLFGTILDNVKAAYVEDFGTAYMDAYEQMAFNLNKVDEFGNTLLIISSQNGSQKIAKLLVEKGANPNHQNRCVSLMLRLICCSSFSLSKHR